ncbi:MAG: LacI family transcriptional regulator [Gemmatales bacterium]|nr:MAG: LacI family transcriptional regulator [Gemmatales bacterium]
MAKRKPTTTNREDKLPRLDRPPTLVTQVEQLLRQAIADGTFAGDRLPTEVELAEQLGVSRETVRRAAEALQREGLLVKFRRRGTFTQPPPGLPQQLVPRSTLIGYLQADYHSRGREEAATQTISGLMLQGALEQAGNAGFELVVRRAPHTKMAQAFQQMQAHCRLRGIIFASYGEEKLLRRAAGLGLPIVLLDHDLHLPQINSVRDDSFAGARQAVAYLASKGHRRIAFANWHRADLNPWRIRGYRQGLRDARLMRKRTWEVQAELTETGARHIVESLLAFSPRPTAVLCFNNTLARLVIDEFRRRGVRVPEDISVMGGGGEVVPGLTCHQADWYETGKQAVAVLVRAISHGHNHAPEHLLSLHLVEEGATVAEL